MSNQTRTNDEIHQYFRDQGCQLLDNYKNAADKMRYVCSCGKQSSISWNKFFGGRRCGYCGLRKKKYSIEEVKDIFEIRGCKLLQDYYIDNKTPVKYLCKCGQEAFISFGAFNTSKQHCILCAAEKRSGPNNWMWIKDRQQYEANTSFRRRCRGVLNRAMKKVGTKLENKIIASLGYSPKNLHERITSNSAWSQIGNRNWHIDHLFPIEAFVDFGIKNTRLVNSLDNLSPTIDKDNYTKGDKYNKDAFKDWLAKKGIIVNEKL